MIPDQHLTELEATAIADGEAAPAPALQHVAGCASCSERVADLALRSIDVHHALVELHATPKVVAVRRSSATIPLVLGVLVAVAASIPLLPSASHVMGALFAGRSAHAQALGSLVRTLFSSARDPAWSLGSTVVLVIVAAAAALIVSRHASRTERNEGVKGS